MTDDEREPETKGKKIQPIDPDPPEPQTPGPDDYPGKEQE